MEKKKMLVKGRFYLFPRKDGKSRIELLVKGKSHFMNLTKKDTNEIKKKYKIKG